MQNLGKSPSSGYFFRQIDNLIYKYYLKNSFKNATKKNCKSVFIDKKVIQFSIQVTFLRFKDFVFNTNELKNIFSKCYNNKIIQNFA